MRKFVLNENDIRNIIRNAVNEGIKDKIVNGVSKASSKIKKGWDKYCDWCDGALEAENPSQIDFKEYGKDVVKGVGSKFKKGWDKYKKWAEEGMDAPNPSYLGDPKDLEECGVQESLRKSIKRMVKEAICEIEDEEDEFNADGYKSISNAGGYEIQLNNNGTARLKNGNRVSDWLEINFMEDGEPFIIDDEGDIHKLSEFMRKF